MGTVVSAPERRRGALYKYTNKEEVKKMALRILTGAIVPYSTKRTGGTAVIEFNPHAISGTDADESLAEFKTIGSAGDFRATPGKVVSMREFVVQDRRTSREDSSASDPFRINDHEWNRDRLVVSWSCESGAQIREISYMIVGEV